MGAGWGPMLPLWTKMKLEDNIRPHFLNGEVIINFPRPTLHMLPPAKYTTHSPLIPLQDYRTDTHCEATPYAIFSISLPRHLYKICDTEDHAEPPFTIFTVAKIYDPSPQLSVTQNRTFQPQEKHAATKYGQQRHGNISANGKKRLPTVVQYVCIRSSSERTTRKLKSNRFPYHSTTLYSYKHTCTWI